MLPVRHVPPSFVSYCNLFFLTNKRVWSEQPQESYQLPAVLQLLLAPVDKILDIKTSCLLYMYTSIVYTCVFVCVV